jgi:hypothetical protein
VGIELMHPPIARPPALSPAVGPLAVSIQLTGGPKMVAKLGVANNAGKTTAKGIEAAPNNSHFVTLCIILPPARSNTNIA